MVSEKNAANAVGGKTARACDSCVKKRARWYCAADDAFLCQACDSSVHSANPLARRHERVRLKTASLKATVEASVPSWHKRKPRTPRNGKTSAVRNPFLVVPELGMDEVEEDEEQLLYRVPVYGPFVADGIESKELLAGYGQDQDVDNLNGFLSSDIDLEEFAADVECLLGRGIENECFGMEGLGLVDCKHDSIDEDFCCDERVKVEKTEGAETVATCDLDLDRDHFELSFDYDTPPSCGDQEEKLSFAKIDIKIDGGDGVEGPKKKQRLLRIDYDGVISAWANQGSPWLDGNRPDFDPDECWRDCMGNGVNECYGIMGRTGGQLGMGDGGREARVTRYREKRRTRLFSKKIRYEVRKLNAEKRPRMKGRFVKRATVGVPAFSLLHK